MKRTNYKKKLEKFPILFGVFLAAILLLVGGQRLMGELLLVPGNPIWNRISSGFSVNSEELAILEDSRLQALRVWPHPQAYADLGLVHLMNAATSTSEHQMKYNAQLSVEYSLQAVELAPRNHFTWLRLASAYLIIEGENSDKAVNAWQRSINLARHEPLLFTRRVHIGVMLFKKLSAKDREMLRDQLLSAIKWNAKHVAVYAKENNLEPWMKFLSKGDTQLNMLLASFW